MSAPGGPKIPLGDPQDPLGGSLGGIPWGDPLGGSPGVITIGSGSILGRFWVDSGPILGRFRADFGPIFWILGPSPVGPQLRWHCLTSGELMRAQVRLVLPGRWIKRAQDTPGGTRDGPGWP